MPASLPRRPLSLALSGAALALVLGAAMGPMGAGAAWAAPAKPVISCPQATSVTGFPIAATPFVQPEAGVTFTSSVTGTLPDGLVSRDAVFGTPSKVQTSTFTVSVTATAADGSTSSEAKTCTMTVKPAPVVSRIAGADRYDQSVKASKAGGDSSSIVFLASGEKFADALSASAIAGGWEAPLLLTPAAAAPPEVLAEIDRLGAETVVVVGGPASVSQHVLDQLATVVTPAGVHRIGGADRYEVSRNLITDPLNDILGLRDIYVAAGGNFPDALSAAPAAALINSAVLLVDGSETALTLAEKQLLTDLSVTRVHIVGGPLSVSAALQADLGKSFITDRADGADRYEASKALIDSAFPTADVVYLASGEVFPDALSGGALAGEMHAPLAITGKTCINRSTAMTIGRLAPSTIVLLGGTATLAPDVERLVKCPLDD